MRSDARVLDERYELRQRLGGGAMGEVWLGYDLRSRRAVAVKLIHRELLNPRYPEELIQRFTREANLLERLEHPGIPAFLDARLPPDADAPYLVMEHILGRDLKEVVGEKNRLSEQEVLAIAAQVCDVLQYTHAIPVIHRDLKPANIMLTDRQRVMVLDFGVAKMFRTDQTQLTLGNRVLGTVAYMPPEQCEGRDVNPRSDLYSLACMLYELLTGIPPFPDRDPARVMQRHRYHTPEPVSLHRPGITPALEAAIMAGLAKQASDRPATAQEFRERLGSLHWESAKPGTTSSPVSTRVPVLAAPDRPMDELLPIHVQITQAQALFDEGLIVHAKSRFASLARNLAGHGPEHADDAARSRLGLARCQRHLGYQEEALKNLLALADVLRPCRPPDDRLLLDVRFHIGQLLLDLGDQHGISELAEVYQALKAADRPEDAAVTAEVRRALTRATLG
ncbi:serine/threonine-protein kinase [Streptomyces atratus]|uniref:serine/threonine-protein kinase n=1 Tax=Streptomyces atratus TaxID=1893 RepID=UPI002259FA76|nr:serine/threonine-protein kinase [Streptomyces atratus]MCX5343691.1 serine/threonine protein kinase [Streptomyces atratus]